MPLEFTRVRPGTAIPALAAAITAAKGDDRLAPVTVVVPTNVSGVMARRALGRERGVLGVDMLTLNRLAELMGGPVLAAQRRRPLSSPVLELAVRRVLRDEPGIFRPVADHPSTVRALRDVHAELRLAGPASAEVLATTSRGRHVARISAAVTELLGNQWYDEADLLSVATRQLGPDLPAPLHDVVLYLPERLAGLALEFVSRLAAHARVAVLASSTGDAGADATHEATMRRLAGDDAHATAGRTTSEPLTVRPARVISTTDADDEATVAVRSVLDAARGVTLGRPVPFERIAILWPTHQPYARLVEHHLTAADIPWNGRGGTELTERLAPRLLLDLLDVDRRGLRRRDLFELLADVPARGNDGSHHPTASWERVSRLAGVGGGDDWEPRLASLARNDRWTDTAESLSSFVTDLRDTLGRRDATRRWEEWADWSVDQIDAWLGKGAIARLSDPEYRGWEALTSALDRLRCLDEISEPVTRAAFRSVLESELDEAGVREGRIGTGVTIGSLASAAGLDVDVAIIMGAAEGLLPPSPRSDPLLSDADRERAELTRSDDRAVLLHHRYRSVVAGVHTIVTVPRGDLRATTEHQPCRWLDAETLLDAEIVPSFAAGLERVEFACSERERRLATLLRTARSGDDLRDAGDTVFQRRLTMRLARESESISVFDGDLSAVQRPPAHERPLSPTQIELWAACPHAYFVQYLLGVRPLDDPDADISITALDRGLLQHDVLDRFHHDVIAGRLAQPTTDGWTTEHREALLGHFEQACDRYESLGRTGRPATWAGERARMRADLLRWLEHDSNVCRSHGTTVIDSEHRFPADDHTSDRPTRVSIPLHDGRLLDLRGSIDRIDRWADGTLVVTDHKTGKDDKFKGLTAADPTLGGTRFQLAAYAAAALARVGDVPDDPAAATVRSEYSMFGKARYRRHGYDTSPDVWGTVRHDLAEVIDGIDAGWFPQLPERPGFRLWPSCHFCEPDGLGTAEPWQRWVAKRGDTRIARWFGPSDDTDHDGHGVGDGADGTDR